MLQVVLSCRKCSAGGKYTTGWTVHFYPLKLHLTTSELLFGQEQEGILPELLYSSGIV